MRVICVECRGKGRIQKTNRISDGYTDLYCTCNDPECGHTFVMHLTYSHTLSPSAKSSNRLTFELIKALTPDKRKELEQQLSFF